MVASTLGGSSSAIISAEEFKNMLRTSRRPAGIAFQLALGAVSPPLGGLTKWAKGLETWINNARINSCETAKAIVSTAAESQAAVRRRGDLAIEMGERERPTAMRARRRCHRPAQHPGLGAGLQRSEHPKTSAPSATDLEGVAAHRFTISTTRSAS